MSRRRNPRLAMLATALGTLAIPAIANAGVTAVTLQPSYSPFGCADVSPATTSITGTLSLPNGTRVGTVTPLPVAATACAGGPGRSIRFDSRMSTGAEGLVFGIRGDDETAPLEALIPVARAEGTTLHLRELTPGSTVNATPVTGTTLDIPLATPNLAIAIPVGARTVTVRPYTSRRVYFYASTDPRRTSVQINDPAPGVPILVEGRDASGALRFTRLLPAETPGADDLPSFFDYPPLGPGGSVRVEQPGVVDRTRTFGSAEFTADGFRVTLPPGAERGRYSVRLALHGPSTDPASPLGPCDTLAPTGALPTDCAPLTTPRLAVQASGLLPVAGDRVSTDASYPVGDSMAITAIRPGIAFDEGSGYLEPSGLSGPFTATLALAGGRSLQHRGVLTGGESETGPLGRDAFPVRVRPGSRLEIRGEAATLSAPIDLTASETAGRVSGRTTPGARVRVSAELGRLNLGEVTVTAGADGAFAAQLPPLPRGSRITVASGDPATGSVTTLQLAAGHRPVRITGAADGQAVRGTVNLTADVDTDADPEWRVDHGWPGTRTRALGLDTARYADGPLRVELRDGPAQDYLYLLVDNTPPAGGAGEDQRIRPGQQAVFVTGARDDGGLATVSARFGDGAPAVQVAGGAATALRHRFAKAGRYTVRVTLTDRAGNVTQDTARVTVTGAAPALRGRVPASVARRAAVRFTARSTAAGRLRVQLMTVTGRTVRTRTTGGAAAGRPIRVSVPTRGLAAGRYLLVRQFIGDAGEVGAVMASPLTIR